MVCSYEEYRERLGWDQGLFSTLGDFMVAWYGFSVRVITLGTSAESELNTWVNAGMGNTTTGMDIVDSFDTDR